MDTPAQERSLAHTNLKGNSTGAAPAVNEFSGEDIIPFDDCETVRNARQRRATSILASSAPAHGVPVADPGTPNDQQATTGLPLEVRKSTQLNSGLRKLSYSAPRPSARMLIS